MPDFIFDKIDKTYTTELNDAYKSVDFKYNKQYSLDEGCLQCLKQNHREGYRKMAHSYIENKPNNHIKPYKNDYIILYDSFVNQNGVILTSDNERYVNGGCLCPSINHTFDKNVQHVDSAITITSLWSDSIWHFPFEAFVSLMAIPKDILYKTKIHVAKISVFVIQWFYYLNIPISQLISGDIHAKTLYIPRMGNCGGPYYSQVKWLSQIVHEKRKVIHYEHEHIILIKRNVRRALQNYDKLEALIQEFCKDIKLPLYIHDDNNLPPLLDQQSAFSNAKFVFAPHGAGGIHMISMKEHAWYIELLPIEDINTCYTNLAHLCNINYKGISMSNMTVDLNKINNVLAELKTKL